MTEQAGKSPDVIYVIESPNATELMLGINEGDALARTLGLAGIKVQYYLASNIVAFDKALEMIGDDIFHFHSAPGDMPMLHISAHGGEDGIELTDEDVIYWGALNGRLEKLHNRVGPIQFPEQFPQDVPRVSVCMSSCSAFSSYLNEAATPRPYQCLIGPNSDIGWCQALVAFSVFYYQTNYLGSAFIDGVTRMNVAAGLPDGDGFKIDMNSSHREVEKVFDQLKKRPSVKKNRK